MAGQSDDAAEPCARCGAVHLTINGHPSCPGHISSGARRGLHCTHELGFGTPHKGVGACKFHAGNTPNAIKSATAKLIEREAREQLGLSEWEPITDPFAALADLAGKAAALENIMHGKVEELASLRQSGGVTGDRIDLTYEAWERATERLSKVLMGMARLDLTDRIARMQAAVDAETASIVRTALAAALAAAPLDDQSRARVLKDFGRRLHVGEPAALKPA